MHKLCSRVQVRAFASAAEGWPLRHQAGKSRSTGSSSFVWDRGFRSGAGSTKPKKMMVISNQGQEAVPILTHSNAPCCHKPQDLDCCMVPRRRVFSFVAHFGFEYRQPASERQNDKASPFWQLPLCLPVESQYRQRSLQKACRHISCNLQNRILPGDCHILLSFIVSTDMGL